MATIPATRPNTHLPDDNGIVFETTDPERTEEFLADAFGTTTKISGHCDKYRFRLTRIISGPFQINTLIHTASADYLADPLPDHVAVVRMHDGTRTNLDVDDALGPGDVSLHTHPGQPYRARLASTRQRAVVLPVQAAAEAAQNRPDDRLVPLGFDSLRPIDPAAASRWSQTVDYVTSSVRADRGAMSRPLLSGAATRLLAATMLATFPNSWTTGADHQDRTDATPTTLSRATAFIDTNADLDIGLLDIAPQWGFRDPSRFTALYRRTYGKLPSQTLRD